MNPFKNLGLERVRMEEDDRYVDVYYAGCVERVISQKDDKFRHHKYKYCILMARSLDRMATICKLEIKMEYRAEYLRNLIKRLEFYRKWSDKFLLIADKFKEGK